MRTIARSKVGSAQGQVQGTEEHSVESAASDATENLEYERLKQMSLCQSLSHGRNYR